MATWPAGLPQVPLRQDFEYTFPETAIRTEMEVGPAKYRQRTSYNVEKVVISVALTAAQVATLLTFYKTTTLGGTIQFTWVHPQTLAAAELQFTGPPKITNLGKDFKATFPAEVLP